jgi:YgiT-type zinc finger domain-containing protein
MTCIQCHGHTAPGHTTMTLERDGTTLLIQAVPAEVCEACGEAYVSGATTTRLTALMDQAVAAHVTTAVQQFTEADDARAEEPRGSLAGA